MGGYQLSLQGTYPSRLDGANSSKSRRGSRTLLVGKKAASKKVASHESPDYYFPNRSESCKPGLENAPGFYPSPPRHSTACCDGLAERRELVKRFQLHKIHGGAVALAGDCNGGSFRSEDSESLALWEEKEKEQQSGKVSVSGELRWMNPWRESVTQAVKKLETAVVSGKDRLMPWKSSSPVHPKVLSSSESARLSLDRKSGSRLPWRDLMGSWTYESTSTSSKSWYRGSSRKNPSGDLSPSNLSQTASCEIVVFLSKQADQLEVKPDLEPLPKEEDEDQEKILSLEHSSDPHSIAAEETRFSPPVVSGDIVSKPELVIESPVSDLHEEFACGNAMEELPLENSVALKVEEKQPEMHGKKTRSILLEPFVGRLLSMKKSYSMDDIFRSCQSGSDVDVDLSMSPHADVKQKGNLRFHMQESSKDKVSPVIDLVAPSAAKFLDLDKLPSTTAPSPAPSPITNSGTVPFNWEEVPGKPKVTINDSTTASGEISCSNLQLPPYLAVVPPRQQTRRISQESLRIHYLKKAMSAPLDGLYHTLPAKFSIPSGGQDSQSALKSKILPTSWLRSPSQDKTDSAIVRSMSVGELKEAFGTFCSTVGRSDLEASTDSTGCNNSSAAIPISVKRSLSKDDHVTNPSSPTSILCGPDDGSVSSDSGLLLNDGGAPPTPATSSSSSSDYVDATFDDSIECAEEDVEVTSPYRLTPAAAMIPSLAETHRISLSFRDFGPSREAAAVREETHEGVQPLMSFLKDNRWFKHPADSLPIFDATFHQSEQFAELSDEFEEAEAPPSSNNNNNNNMFMNDCTVNTQEPKIETASAAVSSFVTKERKEAAATLDFTARLGGRFSPLRIFSNNEECSNGGSRESSFSPAVASSLPCDEESGNRSPTYAATLELFSPAVVNSKKKKKRRSILRYKAHSSRRPSGRVHVRARFLVSITKALRKFFSKQSVKRFAKNTVRRITGRKEKRTETKMLFHVDADLPPTDFQFCKPT